MMPAKKINVAVVGLGFMGTTHLRVYQKIPVVRIVAVCGRSHLPVNGVLRGVQGNINTAANIHLGSGVKIYRDFNELIADPTVELVDICTPTAAHVSQVIAALHAGKHVLCEKPLAGTAADARKILKTAAKSKGLLMPAMCMRFWPGWSWLKDVVSRQTFGNVLAASFRRVTAKPAWGNSGSHPGGALLDLHIHDTDFVNFLFGRPKAVLSRGVINAADAVDHVVTQYFYSGGPVVHAEGNWLWPDGFNMSYTLNCERATIDFDMSRGAKALRVHETGKKTRTIKLKNTDGYREEIIHFVSCVAKGVKPSIVTPQDGLVALEICAAEEKSVRTGAIIKL